MTFYKYVGMLEAMQNKELKEGKHISEVIDGSFKNGNANGFCTIYFQQVAAYKYTGPMTNGLMHGTGEIEYLDGSKLRGNFVDGGIEGNAVWQFSSGGRFDGMFKKSKAIAGRMVYKDGAVYDGPVSEREETDKYTGKKINIIIRHGTGTMTDKDGRKYNVKCEYDNCTETN